MKINLKLDASVMELERNIKYFECVQVNHNYNSIKILTKQL